MKERAQIYWSGFSGPSFHAEDVEKGGIAFMHNSSRPCLTLQMPAVQEVSTASSAWLPCPDL